MSNESQFCGIDFKRASFMQGTPEPTRIVLDFLATYAQVPVISLVLALTSVVSVITKKRLQISKLSSYYLQCNVWSLQLHVGSTKGSSLIAKVVEAVRKASLKENDHDRKTKRERKGLKVNFLYSFDFFI
jgi:hypothetical protein